MKYLSTLLFVSACTSLSAQETFQRMVPVSYATIGSMARDAAGNRYTATSFMADLTNANYGTQAVKYGPDGNMVWNLRLANPTSTHLNCNDMTVSPSGEAVLILDHQGSSGVTDSAIVAKLNANGGLAWTQSFRDGGTGIIRSSGQRVAMAANGDILAGGVTTSTSGGVHDELFLARLSPSGSVLWTKRITAPVQFTLNRIGGIVEDAAGTIMVFGQTTLNTEGSWLLKLSSTGEPLWCRKYSTNTLSLVRPLFLATHGAGYALFYNTGSPQATDHLYRITTDAAGIIGSAIRYLSEGQNGVMTGVTPLPAGGYAVTGSFTPTDVYDNDATLFTTDAAGEVQWAMHYGSPGQESFYAVEPGGNGGFLAAGSGQLDSLTQDRGGLPTTCYLVMTDANGQSFGCDGPATITGTPVTFTDDTYSQIVTDATGWVNGTVLTSTSYEEVAVCPSLGVHDVHLPTLGLYPNPASDRITLASDASLRSVRVHAADGRVMIEQRMDGARTVDVSPLAPGAYVMHALDAQGNVLRGRFVKE